MQQYFIPVQFIWHQPYLWQGSQQLRHPAHMRLSHFYLQIQDSLVHLRQLFFIDTQLCIKLQLF